MARATVEDRGGGTPRFAQGAGMVFAVFAAIGLLAGVTALGYVFTAFATGAAFLNAAFDYCLGRQMYPLIQRIGPAAAAGRTRRFLAS